MRNPVFGATLATLLVLAAPAAVQAQSRDDGQTASERLRESTAEAVAEAWATAPVEETQSVTRHTISAHGQTIRYTATAGALTIRNDQGMPTASMFYVAYTADGADRGQRPVTFLYNGGPGSASIWLHMGSFGPVRVQTDAPEVVRPAPFSFGANPETLLDRTDLVFIDMVGAGYSRPIGTTAGSAFWGVDQDADAFTRAIMRYVTKYDRWTSPKYVLGESYGTLRTGAVAYQLHDRGMALNGVILLSSIMNYGVRQPGYNQDFISLFPTYAATAWYHNRVTDRPAEVETFVQQAREFALGPYASALTKGHMISDAERSDIARQMSRFIGLSPQFIENANLRVDLSSFRKELLRDQRLTVGRLDSRYRGIDPDASGSRPEYDVANTAITGAYFAAFQDYVANTLNYETELAYNLSARGESFEWDWSHRPPAGRPQTTPNTAVDLAAAMRLNPYLKVLSLNGYYDMATPFFSTEFDMAHMMMEPEQRRNIEFTYYPAGHMMYLDQGSLEALHDDLGRFYDDTVNGGAH